jgi:ribosomal protein S18 acetylase RimI-like enzyme
MFIAQLLFLPMPTTQVIQVRVANPEEDSLIAEHFYHMWIDLQVPREAIQPDWLDRTLQFIAHARQQLCYQAFVAEVDRRVVGSASCQLFSGLYPNILTPDYRQFGYIWGVYVESAYRRNGIAKQLTSHTIAHLKAIGCTQAFLNASPMGQPIYDRLGFGNSNSMRLDLLDHRS